MVEKEQLARGVHLLVLELQLGSGDQWGSLPSPSIPVKWYTGIGSRETPPDILRLMEGIAYSAACYGWRLRSGCARGADSAFEDGAFSAYFARPERPKPELYLPWPRFEGRRRAVVAREEPQAEAYSIAAYFHPAWERLSSGAQALHARNVHQVLGRDVTVPALSSFVMCWTPGGRGSGGTGQALRIAKHYGLTIYDLAREEDLALVMACRDFGFV